MNLIEGRFRLRTRVYAVNKEEKEVSDLANSMKKVAREYKGERVIFFF